jgi:hypothetical protein
LNSLGQDYNLRAEDEAGSEADLQRKPAAEFRMLLQQAVRGERDGGR